MRVRCSGVSAWILLDAACFNARISKMEAACFCEGERGERLMQIPFLMQIIALRLTKGN